MELLSYTVGAVCGSSDLNARMRLFAALQLRDEHYFKEVDGTSIENIIDSEILPQFESEVKRAFDITQKQTFFFRIRGLRESPTNPRLKHGCFVLNS